MELSAPPKVTQPGSERAWVPVQTVWPQRPDSQPPPGHGKQAEHPQWAYQWCCPWNQRKKQQNNLEVAPVQLSAQLRFCKSVSSPCQAHEHKSKETACLCICLRWPQLQTHIETQARTCTDTCTRTHISGLNSGMGIISGSASVSLAKLSCIFHGNRIICSTAVLNHTHLNYWRDLLIIQIPETLPNLLKKNDLQGWVHATIVFNKLGEYVLLKWAL